MRRRDVLTGSLASAALLSLGGPAFAQPARLSIIALLMVGRPDGRPTPLIETIVPVGQLQR